MEGTVGERFEGLRGFYAAGTTRDVQFRLDALRQLKNVIEDNADAIAEALREDLGKSPEESYISETSVVLGEIRQQMKYLRKWARDEKVKTPLFLFPSKSRIIYEPKGVVLIIAPWNYPFQLALDPLVGAIATGNCVALKPSTTSSATCALIKKMIGDTFPENYVTVFDGDHDQTAQLLKCRFDHIFFTGGSSFGRTVMMEAAKNLVPVTLELGGKSPCIVDKAADLDVAARRIVWGKLMNAGQTCIAPDYFFVHKNIKDEFIGKLKVAIGKFYGDDLKTSPGYPRIISDKAFARLEGYLSGSGDVVYGGETDAAQRYISPTILDNVTEGSPVMKEEIFGPIFPIMAFEAIETVVAYINRHEKPLAFYYFGRKREGRRILGLTTSGGACINDTIVHIANPNLPFGGIGMSGTGHYHSRYSFETFSNARGTVISRTRVDIKMRYPPYGKFKTLKKLL